MQQSVNLYSKIIVSTKLTWYYYYALPYHTFKKKNYNINIFKFFYVTRMPMDTNPFRMSLTVLPRNPAHSYGFTNRPFGYYPKQFF